MRPGLPIPRSLVYSATTRHGFHSSQSLQQQKQPQQQKQQQQQHVQGTPRPLATQTSLITGASRGIGAAIARRFASEGVRCILAGRNECLLEQVKDELDEPQGGHRVVVGDVAEGAFWEGLKREKIDILVNAAGITHYSPLFVTSTPLLESVMRTNLMGTMMGCRAVGKGMMARKGGCIINVASLLGIKGGKGSSAYAASKAGVVGLTRALAAELGEKNVRVNVILPGYIETDMTDAMTPMARSDAQNSIPLRRFGKVAEIADAAVFLATNQYANNCVLNLDGGLSAV
ncbi:uncharacterized protein L3040_000206 [Drepanopeziza brunnea f. sp. 'multigermtubi']|uniref:3-oxoacyl-acyl carrier protein reductase n=1 Tax=Marssonina brunnea f. sp. multigermtubi (strain MB_m1) TaxID=1072389 RepID=K1X1K5_MARBU|nr:3-oxoacyl-acyl carrier protein reductase [Drepanopeziza brunnea f. sp. 'multigermtubi' MB_m1]EKD14683.1 3-oxoacyl-acyl carrier protein reductase [Drepanopeziza brunnea f. sp. 'multigermtubi' MB_m1]KAJ5053916.1 hypothetical protein L3040_000206 [Drepanopeziza brunnea f. sp. 'multigermtubi']